MRRTGWIIVLCLIGITTAGCANDANSTFSTADGTVSSTTPYRIHGGVGPASSAIDGESSTAASPKTAVAAAETGASPGATPAGLSDPVAGKETTATETAKQQTSQSGVLTAGSFDDNVDPLVFTSLLRKFSQQQGAGDLVGKLQGRRLVVIVKDAAGKPVGNARVRLAGGGSAGVELTTRSDGRAVFLLSYDKLPDDQDLLATVTGPNGARTGKVEAIAAGVNRWEITMPGVQAALPRNLDLAIVLDTTGSMGDELEYLKTEIRGIADAVARKYPEVRQRFSLVLYRDEGDEYVVRRFDFTESINEFHKRLSAQSAGGGGDYPEAVHKGLEEALQLRWGEADTARVLFLVGDAPPHAQHMGRTLTAVDNLRKKGIAIYPVACSGYDPACELVMRTCALLTGSQFLFLTDDSGVGSAHAEPSIPYYQVERLDRLMIRMISSELSGQRIQPNAGEIIRTVGKKVN